MRKLKKGNLVKLIFVVISPDSHGTTAERMWVKIVKHKDDIYEGLLDNHPMHIKDLVAGDPISFEERHIIGCDMDYPESELVLKYSVKCFVTTKVLNENDKFCYLYRDEPNHEDHSGWHIMAGDKSAEYMGNAKNIAYVSLGVVLSEDDSFIAVIDASVEKAFRKSTITGNFEEINSHSSNV